LPACTFLSGLTHKYFFRSVFWSFLSEIIGGRSCVLNESLPLGFTHTSLVILPESFTVVSTFFSAENPTNSEELLVVSIELPPRNKKVLSLPMEIFLLLLLLLVLCMGISCALAALCVAAKHPKC
jgi:hypothetical protein